MVFNCSATWFWVLRPEVPFGVVPIVIALMKKPKTQNAIPTNNRIRCEAILISV
jgi:hypothetical protein